MEAQLYLLGAKKVQADRIRFVFMSPIPGNPDVMQGNGALLEVTEHKDLWAGNHEPLRDSLLEAFIETIVEGDEDGPGKGPIPCGIGLCGDELQIVEWGDAKPIVGCRGKLFTYMSNIDVNDMNKDKE